MSKFTDTEGRVWNVQLSVYLAKQVKQRLNVDLLNEQIHETLASLTDDIVKGVDVLYVLCSQQAEKNNVTDEEFGRSLSGDVLFDGINAMVEALIDFFPNPKKRMWIRKLWEKSTDHQNQTNEKMLAILENEEIDRELELRLNQTKDDAINEALSGLKSGNLPESSG